MALFYAFLLALALATPEPRIVLVTVENPRALVERAGGTVEAVAAAIDATLPAQGSFDRAIVIVAAAADMPRTFTISGGPEERAAKVRAAAGLALESAQGLFDDTVERDVQAVEAHLRDEFPGGFALEHRRMDATALLPISPPATGPASSETGSAEVIDREALMPSARDAIAWGVLPAVGLVLVPLLVAALFLGWRWRRGRPGRGQGPQPASHIAPAGPAPVPTSAPSPAKGHRSEPAAALELSIGRRRRRPGPAEASNRSGRNSILNGLLGALLLAQQAAAPAAAAPASVAPTCAPVLVVDVSGSTPARTEAGPLAEALLRSRAEVGLIVFSGSVQPLGTFASAEAVTSALDTVRGDGSTAMAEVYYHLGADALRKRAAGCSPLYVQVSDYIDDNPTGADAGYLPPLPPPAPATQGAPGDSLGSLAEPPQTGLLSWGLVGLAGLVGLVVGLAGGVPFGFRRRPFREVAVRVGDHVRLLTLGDDPVELVGASPSAIVPLRHAPGGLTLRLLAERSELPVLGIEVIGAPEHPTRHEPAPSAAALPTRSSLLS